MKFRTEQQCEWNGEIETKNRLYLGRRGSWAKCEVLHEASTGS